MNGIERGGVAGGSTLGVAGELLRAQSSGGTPVSRKWRGRAPNRHALRRQETWQELIVALRTGSSGEAVRAVQRQLAHQGFDTAVDGQFGPRTGDAVRAFQDAHGLTSSGVVEPPTWKALVA